MDNSIRKKYTEWFTEYLLNGFNKIIGKYNNTHKIYIDQHTTEDMLRVLFCKNGELCGMFNSDVKWYSFILPMCSKIYIFELDKLKEYSEKSIYMNGIDFNKNTGEEFLYIDIEKIKDENWINIINTKIPIY